MTDKPTAQEIKALMVKAICEKCLEKYEKCPYLWSKEMKPSVCPTLRTMLAMEKK